VTGVLINSAYSNDTHNRVNLRFAGCDYDDRFGAHPPAGRQIANVDERGTWTFHEADFAGRPRADALNEPGRPGVTVNVEP
jgi:hypothetical protein